MISSCLAVVEKWFNLEGFFTYKNRKEWYVFLYKQIREALDIPLCNKKKYIQKTDFPVSAACSGTVNSSPEAKASIQKKPIWKQCLLCETICQLLALFQLGTRFILYQAQNSSKNSVVLSDFVFWRSSVEKRSKIKCNKINRTPCTFTLISSSMLTAAHTTWSINNIMKFLN